MAQTESESEKLRTELLKLNSQRDKIEREIKEWQSILRTQSVGMNDELVDGQGYPRNDIDVHQVRSARNKIICLQNDCRVLMKEIEEKLFQYHESQRKEQPQPQF